LKARAATPVWLAALLLGACTPRAEQPAPADIQAARQAVLAFDQQLRREITARLERNEDPVAVYMSYADHAPDWGREISNQFELDFSRTALGVRNPASAPDAWESEQLAAFNFLMDSGIDPDTFENAEVVQEGEETVFRWIQPVRMQDTCLVCHGETIDPRIKLLLAQEYPLDEALGYAEGQIGGAYSVRRVLRVGDQPAPPWTPIPEPETLPADQRSPADAPLVTAQPPL
jgi:hypothetical protein